MAPKTIVCIATGPSLTADDVAYCKGKTPVLVVNDSYRWAPWADWLYAADYDWWLSTARGESLPNHDLSQRVFFGERLTCDPAAAEQWGLRLIEHRATPSPGCVWGSTSGFEAFVAAVRLFGAERVLLLGYDMGATGTGHWFGDHPTLERDIHGQRARVELQRTQQSDFPAWRQEFEAFTRDLGDVEVINCTRDTALTCFPRMIIGEAL